MTTTLSNGRSDGHLVEAPAGEFAGRQTLAHYASALDRRDPPALAGVLTEDATWTFTIGGAAGPGPFAGRAAILDFVRGAMTAQDDRQRHHLTNILVRGADAGTAVVEAYLMLTSSAGGSPRLTATGSYVTASA